MDDLLTLTLIVVLFKVLKPIVKAILRGMGSSENGRDK